jgi:pimeloyl-ACP methyl ester carboxylesterase
MIGYAPDGTFYHLHSSGPETNGGTDGGSDKGSDKGSGDKAIILIHGLGLNHAMWQHQTAALAQAFSGHANASYQVLSYDLYGHGKSPPPPETPSLTLFSRQLKALMQHLNINSAIVMGFSLGGMIVRRFAMDYPDMADAIAVLHSPHQRDQAAHDKIQNRVYQAKADGPDATVEDALIRWFSDHFRLTHTDVMDEVRQWVKANDRDIYPQIYQVLVDGVKELINPEPPIICPALVMTGDEDFGNNPDMSAAIAKEIPKSELCILKNLRHMAMLEAPEAFNTVLIRFINHVNNI